MRRLLVAMLLAFGAVVVPVTPSHALTAPKLVSRTSTPAYNGDAPDPTIVQFGTKYYAYTTGTTWGNHIGILVSSSPNTGYHTIPGRAPGKSGAFPSFSPSTPIRPWFRAGTTHAPSVFAWAGRYVLYYAAQTTAAYGSHYCLSVATSSKPEGPFVDNTTTPWLCMNGDCGAIDPQPYGVTSTTAYLIFKTYDDVCHTAGQRSKIWRVLLSTDALGHGTPRVILDQNQWNTSETLENPQVIHDQGTHLLMVSRGDWHSSAYREQTTWCTAITDPAQRCGSSNGTLMSSYSGVNGAAGGTIFRGANKVWLAYQGFYPSCASGCTRKLYVAQIQL